ncbi:MAG: CehA/McbA family metallohydrolase [Christensenellales bacterium]|nr:CehA/McbA family metallohydrolase [Clostridiales bacterium]
MSKNYHAFELHCHTNHSDGDMTPAQLVDNAVKKAYDGIAVTDHNTDSAAQEVYELGKQKGLFVIKGIEWTTFYGHLTAMGGNNDIDWREINKDNIDHILKRAYDNGVVVVIAHPKRYGTPVCTGCYLDLPITAYEYVAAVEVWSQKNPHLSYFNEKAIQFYDNLLRKGYKLAAVYGYDWHREDKQQRIFAMTRVGGKVQDALEAIKKGDTYVSLGLYCELFDGGKRLPFGAVIDKGVHSLELKISQSHKHIYDKYAVIPQEILLTGSALKEDVRAKIGKAVEVNLDGGYLRFEVMGEAQGIKNCRLLLTSPIYIQ